MSPTLRQILPAMVLLMASASVLADGYEEAREILERMAAAMNQLSYQGTFVYVRGEDVETMRITHVNDEQGTRERMFALDGPQREIIRDQKGIRCALGEDTAFAGDPLVTRSIFPELPIDELVEARGRYQFKTGASARIAGHKGRSLTIFPRDEYRYGYKLWLEEETGLLLRWVLYDADRRTLAKLMFTELKIGEGIDTSELETNTPLEAFVRLESAPPVEKPVNRPGRRARPEGMPPGFRLAFRSESTLDEEAGFLHLVYSDGLASVSVYIESFSAAQGVKEGLSRLGTSNAYSRTTAKRQVTAIGEVPAITVKTIGNAFADQFAAVK